MIGQAVKLTRIRGTEVEIHYSWFIVFVLITFSLTARFASDHPQWTLVEHYAVGIATSLLFFSSILVHELAHSFVALAKGECILGMITRDHLLRVLTSKMELGLPGKEAGGVDNGV